MGFVVGDVSTFSKTVSESDVYLFAGITGDLARNHVDSAYMAATPYGRRIAHGVLVLGYTSTASTKALERAGEHGVSYGYDRVRFCAPVFLGDTITVRYTVERIEPAERKVYSAVRVTNQDDVVCLAATHVLKLIERSDDGASDNAASDNAASDNAASDNAASDNAVPERAVPDDSEGAP